MKKKDDVLKQFLFELKKYIVPLKHSNAKKKVVLAGKNKENICNPWRWKQIMFSPIKIENERVKVIIKWLVIVKL